MAERTYIEYDNARITRGEGILLNVEMFDGRRFDGAEARRLFPLTGLRRYITLLDEEGVELAVIRDLDNLLEEDSRKAVEQALKEYYLIPKITQIFSVTEKYGRLRFSVGTDSGKYEFDVRNSHADIKFLFDGRVLIKDSSDNRYDIPDVKGLDKKSLHELNPFL